VIVSDHQDLLAEFLCTRIGLEPSKHLRCLGRVRDDVLIAVVGFDGWTGTSCQMHCAGDDPRWINRDFLKIAFSYPFDNGCNVLLGLVPSANERAVKLNHHLGFSTLVEIPGAHPDGSLIIMAMQKADCRWIEKEEDNGKEISTATAA
tara:strand:+ start:943 stop:1386 length:444 start_codon:yes stop_codon:yes gene_type:complete